MLSPFDQKKLNKAILCILLKTNCTRFLRIAFAVFYWINKWTSKLVNLNSETEFRLALPSTWERKRTEFPKQN